MKFQKILAFVLCLLFFCTISMGASLPDGEASLSPNSVQKENAVLQSNYGIQIDCQFAGDVSSEDMRMVHWVLKDVSSGMYAIAEYIEENHRYNILAWVATQDSATLLVGGMDPSEPEKTFIVGLQPGSYEIIELQTVPGYFRLTIPIEIEIITTQNAADDTGVYATVDSTPVSVLTDGTSDTAYVSFTRNVSWPIVLPDMYTPDPGGLEIIVGSVCAVTGFVGIVILLSQKKRKS